MSYSDRFLQVVCLVGFLSTTSVSGAQSTQRPLVGRVVDDAGAPVPYATVAVRGTLLNTQTSVSGLFVLAVPRDSLTLDVRKVGFEPTLRNINQSERTETIHVEIRRLPAALAGVYVRDVFAPGAPTLTRSTVRNLPPVGEPDVLRALPFLPAVSQPNDAAARVNLAGASSDETLITLDDHPVLSGAHFTGTTGMFAVAAIEQGGVHMHYVPSDVDARLGGVIRLRTRELRERGGESVVSLLSAGATVMEPALPGGLSVLASARMTYMDLVFDRFVSFKGDGPGQVPTFRDALVKIRAGEDRGWRTELLAFGSSDTYDKDWPPGAPSLVTAQRVLGVRLNRDWQKVSVRVRASGSAATASDPTPSFENGLLTRQQRDEWNALALTWIFQVSPSMRATVGSGYDRRSARHVWNGSTVAGIPRNYDGSETQGLINVHGSLARETSTYSYEIGTRVTQNGGAAFIAPRLRFEGKLGPSSRWEVSAARRHQFDADFTDLAATPAAVPLFLFARPSSMDGIAATVETRRFGSDGRDAVITVSTFARQFANRPLLLDAPPDTVVAASIGVRRVRGQSLGASVAFAHRWANGAVIEGAYSFTRSFEVRGDDRIPATWDLPHTLSGMFSYPVGRKTTFVAAGQAHSGAAITPSIGRVFVPYAGSPWMTPRAALGEERSARVAPFYRLDLGIRRTWKPGRFEIVGSAQVVNVLARKNVLAYDLNRLWNFAIKPDIRTVAPDTSIPMIPSIGVEIRW